MTPAEAAALLEVAVDAGHEQVERAYRYQAQRFHPDRLPYATPAERAAAAIRFDRITRARTVLRDTALRDAELRDTVLRDSVLRDTEAERMPHSPAGSDRPAAASADLAGSARRPAAANRADEEPYQPLAPAGPWLFWVWVGLYAFAAMVSFLGGPLPHSAADFWLRLLPLGLAAVAFARTGHTLMLGAVVVFGALTAVLTVLFASFGPLLAMLFLGPPVLGLVAQGRQQHQLPPHPNPRA